MNEVPNQLQAYLDVLGPDMAVEFLLAFGGTPVYFSTKPTKRSDVGKLIGLDNARQLAVYLGPGLHRVPLCKPWIARHLRSQGVGVLAIARRLHVDATNVRRWFADGGNQLSLF